jgi:hypothetical protein
MARKNESKPTSFAVVFFAKIPMESFGAGLSQVAAAMPPDFLREALADFEVKDPPKAKAKRKPAKKAKLKK